MIGRPGSLIWLLGHELRLASRRGRRMGRGGRVSLIFLFGVPILLSLMAGIPLGFLLNRVEVTVTPVASAVAAVLLATAFTLMLSHSLSAAVDALYERADLDLLFSSPLSPRTVMTVRFLGVATGVFLVYAYFLAGPLACLAVMGHPEWTASLVVLAAVALASAGGGLLLAAALFRVLGPRRTRTVAQVLAALIGAAIFLTAQARNILGEGRSETAMQQVMRLARDPTWQVPGLDWPLRAFMGEPLPMLGVAAVGAAVFGIANLRLGPRFASDAASAAGASHSGGRKAVTLGAFASGPFAVTLAKELRLLGRDPALITQVLLRVLYMLPLGFLLLRGAADDADYRLPGAAAGLVLVAGQVAGSLAWITVSAEDAPDLLASAPAPVRMIRRAKMAAAGLPVAVMLLPFLVPLVVLKPLAGVAAILGATSAITATCLINIWWQRPAKRSEFQQRRRASWFVTVAEVVVGLLLGAATASLAAGFVLWSLIPAAVSALAVLALRRSDAKIAEALRAAA